MASNAAVLSAPSSRAACSQPLGVAAGEDDLGALGAGAPGRLEPDAGAAADHDDGLAEQLRFALRRGGRWLRWSSVLRWFAAAGAELPPAHDGVGESLPLDACARARRIPGQVPGRAAPVLALNPAPCRLSISHLYR